jgi:REP element-mobilizing transposase RayT
MAPSFTPMNQAHFFPKNPTTYGGDLLKTRAGRRRPRPLSTRSTMHFVLRSTLATGPRSFRRPENAREFRALLAKFSAENGITVHSAALPGNHIHLHLRLKNRHTYKAFIRAFAAAVALALGGRNGIRFWDRRPFSRVVYGRRDFLGVQKYVRVNFLEEQGFERAEARRIIEKARKCNPVEEARSWKRFLPFKGLNL